MPDAGLLFVIFIILVALAFDFTNGMHDAANSIATPQVIFAALCAIIQFADKYVV